MTDETILPRGEATCGVRFDFNEGARVFVPEGSSGHWRVKLTDEDAGNTLYDTQLASGLVVSAKKWFVRFRIEVWHAGDVVLDHRYDARDKDVLIRFHIGTLGDVLAWLPYAAAFAERHGCRLTCCLSGRLIPLFRDAYPHIRFMAPESVDDRSYYATYKMMMFFGDTLRAWNPSDGRHLSLQQNAAHLLGVDPVERRPLLRLPDETRPIAEPYVCIATQATGQAKYWNNPEGWDQTVVFLKSLGLRVICIDQKASKTVGMVTNVIPRQAEDETGDRPITERARWLRHATAFIGLSSGLSWLAWAAGCPVVLVSGFTHPRNEFATPYRVINWHSCNSCWNDTTARYDRNDRTDFLWCPRHKGTPRMFECSRLITAHQVINTIRRVSAISVLEGKASFIPRKHT
jgi:autotransporter strand-loop-strand O-heptosyltransferase